MHSFDLFECDVIMAGRADASASNLQSSGTNIGTMHMAVRSYQSSRDQGNLTNAAPGFQHMHAKLALQVRAILPVLRGGGNATKVGLFELSGHCHASVGCDCFAFLAPPNLIVRPEIVYA